MQHCGNNAAHRAALVAADRPAEGLDGVADLVEDALDETCGQEEGSDGREALLHGFLAFADHVVRQLALGDCLRHHGDLGGFVFVGHIPQDDHQQDQADHAADREADQALVKRPLRHQEAQRRAAAQDQETQDLREKSAVGEAQRTFVDFLVVHLQAFLLSL